MWKSKRENLLEDPVGGTLLRLTGPMVLGLLAVILFNVVDTFYVGRLGALELAAMSFTFPVVFLVMSMAIGIGVGVTAIVSRVIGAGDQGRVRRLTTDGLLLANTIVIAVALTGLATIDPLFRVLGASPEIIALIRKYMLPWYLGVGFIVIPMVGNSAIRATGDTKTPSMIMIIAGGLNIILDPLLIFGLGPFPRLELQGAALGTVIAYAVTFFAALWILWRRERMIDLSRPRPRDVLVSWRQILYVGAPAAATQMLVPVGSGILTRMVSAFGPEAVAAFGVGTRIESLSMIGPMALGSSVTPFVGQNLGAGQCRRVRAALRFCVRACIVYGIAIAALLAAFAPALGAVFNRDPEVVALITRYLYIIPASYGLFGIMFSVNSTFNAAKQPMKAALIIAVRLFVLAIPLSYLGAVLAGIPGLFAGISTANALVGILAVLLVRRYLAVAEETLSRDAQLSPA